MLSLHDSMRGQEERANESTDSWAIAEEWRALYARARFLTQDHDVAQDLVQETLLRAIAAAPHCEDASQRRAWLQAVLRNLFIDRCRARAVMARAEREALCLAAGAESKDEREDVLDVLSARDVEDACRGLCERDRDLLKGVYLQRRPHKEVAAASGIKQATVATRLFRAKGRLRQVLQDLLESRVAAMDGLRPNLRSPPGKPNGETAAGPSWARDPRFRRMTGEGPVSR